jgi:acetyl-CoA acetyltransferase
VFVVGVGMHPFGNNGVEVQDMAYAAGIAALDDSGLDFPEVGALYNGYIGGGITTGVHVAKDLGLTGIPITHVENASGTGSCAFGEAVHAVAGGRVEVAMALGLRRHEPHGGAGPQGPAGDRGRGRHAAYGVLRHVGDSTDACGRYRRRDLRRTRRQELEPRPA